MFIAHQGQMDKDRILKVTVIVYAAKNLEPYRKGDVCHASVVFGHGKDFYTTEVIESSNPEWNQEASLPITNSCDDEPIRFKVKDRDHTLGSVTLPVSKVENSPKKVWLPLQPHKRASEVHGSLLSCWVVDSTEMQINSTSSHILGDTNIEEKCVPEVTGVSPNKGPIEGGQRVILRGSCLGESAGDVVQVLVAGVDCTSSVEYFSSSKLAIVTKDRAAPGSGPVVVHTRTGGVGVSWINFSFTAEEKEFDKEETGRLDDSATQTELISFKQKVRELKERNKTLVEENEQLRGYIERLLVGVINHSPGVLEIGQPPSLSDNHTQ